MPSRLLATIIIFPIWLVLVLVFRRYRQWLLYYLVAAFGFAIQVIFLAEYFGLDQLLVDVASFHVSLIAKSILKLNVELLSQGSFILNMPQGGGSILKLGIECSAVLESTILIALVGFYPLFRWPQKLLRITFGLVVTYVINILRLLIIVLMTYKLGSDYIFVAHAFVARAFFFMAELILYWYLMTKPTVKSVGDAIQGHVKVEKVAVVGRSLKMRHALGQLTTILLVLLVSVMSFGLSDDWKKSFSKPTLPKNRPLIYQDETDLQSKLDQKTNQTKIYNLSPASSIYQEFSITLAANQKENFSFTSRKSQTVYVQIPEGKGEIASRLLVNGNEIQFVNLTVEKYLKKDSVFRPVSVSTGDVLEVKFQNTSAGKTKYLVRVKPDSESDYQFCRKDEIANANLPKAVPSPTPSPVPLPSPQISITPESKLVAVRGVKTQAAVEQGSMGFTLKSEEKTVLGFQNNSAGELKIQLTQGRSDIAARLYLNGQSVDFVTMAPWRYLKEESIFKTVSVKPGDYLEIKFQNLDSVSSDFTMKVLTGGETNGQ